MHEPRASTLRFGGVLILALAGQLAIFFTVLEPGSWLLATVCGAVLLVAAVALVSRIKTLVIGSAVLTLLPGVEGLLVWTSRPGPDALRIDLFAVVTLYPVLAVGMVICTAVAIMRRW